MAEDAPRSSGDGGDARYFGPYDSSGDSSAGAAGGVPGADRPAPLGIGSWGEDTRPLPPQRPSFTSYAPPAPGASGYDQASYGPPPAAQQSSQAYGQPYGPPSGQPVGQPAYGFSPPGGTPPGPGPGRTPKPRRPVRAGTVVAVAAITALLVGGGAGYAGSRLAEQAAPTTSAPTDPASRPAPSSSSSTNGGASRTPVPAAPGSLDAVEVAAAALPSAVMIRVGSGDDTSIGSGFVLDDSGLIMTNNHVVAGAASGEQLRVVFSDGVVAGASLVGRSPTYDIAVIRVKTSHELVPMPVGDSDATRVGESVLAIGSPLGLPGTVTQGIVSARNRPVAVGSEGQSANAYINGTQTDAPINPGNSGGPLLDAGGRVIGVNSAILTLGGDRQSAGNIGLGFAIPINQAMQIGEMLIADGKATYPIIGADVASAGDQGGVRLSSVTGGGPAARAGLRRDDVVTKIDGQAVSASEELIVAVRSHRPGDRVTLTYRRDGGVRQAQVTLGSREG